MRFVQAGFDAESRCPLHWTTGGRGGTPRLYDTGEPTNVLPLSVVLTDLSGAPYTGAQSTITANAGTGFPALLGGSVPITGTVTANAGSGYPVSPVNATVSVTPSVTSNSLYLAGNLVGGLLSFTNALRSLTGKLTSVTVACKSLQLSIGMKLYLFKANPSNSSWVDKHAPAINGLDVPNVLGVLPLSSVDTGLGTCSVWVLDGIEKAITSASSTVYAALVTLGAPLFGSTSDVTVTLGIIQD